MTQITTGPNGETLFDGMTANELANSLVQRSISVSVPHSTAERMRTAAAALRHLSAQPQHVGSGRL